MCNKSTCILHLAGYGRHVTVLSCGLLPGVWQSNLMIFGFSCPDYTWMTSLHFDRLWQELVEVLDINVVCFQLDLASLLFESIWGLSYFMSPSERENFHQNSERYKYYCEMMSQHHRPKVLASISVEPLTVFGCRYEFLVNHKTCKNREEWKEALLDVKDWINLIIWSSFVMVRVRIGVVVHHPTWSMTVTIVLSRFSKCRENQRFLTERGLVQPLKKCLTA